MTQITEKKFKNYKMIQQSGLTNMMEISDVSELSKFCAVINEDNHFSLNILTVHEVKKCIENYGHFMEIFSLDEQEIAQKGDDLRELRDKMEDIKSYGKILSLALDDENPVINIVVKDKEEFETHKLGILEDYSRILEVSGL